MFVQLLVEYVIRLVPEAYAPEAVLAVAAIEGVGTVGAGVTELAGNTSVGVVAIGAPEAVLTLKAVAAIDAVLCP